LQYLKTIIQIAVLLSLLSACNTNKKSVTHYVEIKQMKFIPEVLEVAPGDSVIWTNRDIVEHNVFKQNNQSWKSQNLKMGESFSQKITGSNVEYICTLHPVMKGRIVITD